MTGGARQSRVDLLMLPGMDGTGRLFAPVLAELPPWIRAHVVAYPSQEALPLPALARQAAQAMPEAGAVVLAESFSGLVALQMLADGVPGIRGVIFVAAFGMPPRPWLLGVGARLPVLARLASRVPGSLLRYMGLGRTAPAAVVEAVRAAVAAPHPQVLAQRLAIMSRDAGFAPLRVRGVPCRYFQASRDRLVPASAVAFFRERFADFACTRVEGPHFLLQANPGGAARAIAEACAGVNTIPTQPSP